jgi:integrase
MPRLKKRLPAYRLHKASGQAIVSLSGRDFYLGPWNSPESHAEYSRLIKAWEANGRRPMPESEPVEAPPPEDELSMAELMVAYLRHVDAYYVKNGKPTSEPGTIRDALRFVRRLYRNLPASRFSPKKLKRVRQAMIDHDITRTRKVRDPQTGKVVIDPETGKPRLETWVLAHGLSRKLINKHISRIRLMFAWAVEEELLPVSLHAALIKVKPLRKGKSQAREKPRVTTVPARDIEAVLALVPETIRAMIQAQLLCGCRPHEICEIRVTDIDVSDPTVWQYRPQRFKSEHHNEEDDPDKDRVIFIGPRCQAILKPFLARAKMGYLFSPIRSEEARNAERKANRKTPMTPSQRQRKPKGRPHAPFRDHYDVASYRRAIRRACLKAGITPWGPHRLRHNTATMLRRQYDIEASSTVLGHAGLQVTAIYAEQDRERARCVMSEVG